MGGTGGAQRVEDAGEALPPIEDHDEWSGTSRPAPRPDDWGKEDDSPAPEIKLAADLPADIDDPDPSTADLEGDPTFGVPIGTPVGVKFTGPGKIYLFDAGDDGYQVGEQVVVDTERGPRIGTVAVSPARRALARGPLRRVLRRPAQADLRRQEENEVRARDVLRTARDTARDIGLAIKLFRAELSLSGNKAVIYFSTDDKVDFRRLVRELSTRVHVRIEMRQTGVRDEAKMVGGIGSCGLELCCSTWLPAFVPVSIKNAKDQGLVLNPSKVSGQCGRLKCCLVYEQETYAELRKGLPKLGKRVVTDAGEGRVVEVDVLRQRVRVSLVNGEQQTLPASEVRPMFPSQGPDQGRPPPHEP